MLNSTDFYKGIFWDIIPVRIIVPCPMWQFLLIKCSLLIGPNLHSQVFPHEKGDRKLNRIFLMSNKKNVFVVLEAVAQGGFINKVFLNIFWKFSGKHMSSILFLNEVLDWIPDQFQTNMTSCLLNHYHVCYDQKHIEEKIIWRLSEQLKVKFCVHL